MEFFFFHEAADGLSCTKQGPLVVDVRAPTEGALHARRQLVQVVSVDPGGSRPSSRAGHLAIRRDVGVLQEESVHRFDVVLHLGARGP